MLHVLLCFFLLTLRLSGQLCTNQYLSYFLVNQQDLCELQEFISVTVINSFISVKVLLNNLSECKIIDSIFMKLRFVEVK